MSTCPATAKGTAARCPRHRPSMHACVCTVHTVPRVFTVAHKRCSYSVDTVLQTVARSRFSPSNGDTVGNASSFGSLSPFPGTMSCRRVWSSAVAHPCHRTNAAPCQFATSLTQGAANATSVCQSLARGWWVPSPPLHRTVPQRHKRVQYHGTSSVGTLFLPWHRRCRPCLGIHCRSSGDCGVRHRAPRGSVTARTFG